VSRKKSTEYTQVCIYLHNSIATQFKIYCLNRGQEYSVVAEEIFKSWLEQQENNPKT